jgi:hypothetical protein
MPVLLQRDYRTAAMELIGDYITSGAIAPFQLYRGRPSAITPPTGFVDRMSDRLVDFIAPNIFQHSIGVQVVVLHGTFDSGNTVDQRDRFVDGFLDWVRTRFHAAGANTLLRIVSVDDEPDFIPEWLPPERRLTYYGTRITLEGDATD